MAFTDVELAILAQLSYKDIPANVTLEEILLNNMSSLKKSLGVNFYEAIDKLYYKVRGRDYVIVQSINESHTTGFAAFAVRDPDNCVTVATRGTEGKFLDSDWKKDAETDLEIGLRRQTDQQRSMERFIRKLEDRGYDGYYFTGHSLGGNLAMHGAISIADQDKVLGVRAYNAPGFNKSYLRNNSVRISRVQDRITAFQNEYDYVSSLLSTPGNIVITDSEESAWSFGFAHHSIRAFTIDGTGSFQKKKRQRKGWRNGPLRILSGGIDVGWRIEMGLEFGLFGLGYHPRKIRDFSNEMEQLLCQAAKETSEERWWEIQRWDCWYRLQGVVGKLKWDQYSGKVNSYYRKLIDINNASVRDIQAIFREAYDIDRRCAADVAELSERLETNIIKKVKELSDGVSAL